MLGPSHALSGAAVWLAASFGAMHFAHFHQSPAQIAIGTAMCAGGALVPDLDLSGRVTADKGGATVAHTFGVVSLFAAECIEKVSLGVYDVTKAHRDPHRHNGHRTLTHTLVFTALVGWGVYAGCALYGKTAVLVTLFLAFAMALRGLFARWSKRAGWLLVTAVAGWATYVAYGHLPAGRGYPVLGVAIGAGCVVHLLGDVITKEGCPLFWPLPIARRRWFDVGVPNAVAVKVGGAMEVIVLRTMFFLISLAAAVGLAQHWAGLQISRLTG